MTKSRIYTLVSIIIILVLSFTSIFYFLRANSLSKDLSRLNVVAEVNSPLEQQVIAQQIQIDSLLMQLEEKNTTFNDSSSIQIQLGLFRSFDISAYQEQYHALHQESKGDLNVVLMRGFTDIQAAESALKQIKKLGIKGAFIVE